MGNANLHNVNNFFSILFLFSRVIIVIIIFLFNKCTLFVSGFIYLHGNFGYTVYIFIYMDRFRVILFANGKKRWGSKGYFLQLYHMYVNLGFLEQIKGVGDGYGGLDAPDSPTPYYSRSSHNIHVSNFV